MNTGKNIILAITGASGAIYARLLMREIETLRDQTQRVAVVCSANAEKVWEHELGEKMTIPSVFTRYRKGDFFSPLASGSSGFDTMIVCPCSMGTAGRIASGTSDDLILRAADVILKEKKKLILVPRETPFNLIHLTNLKFLAEAGAHIIPAIPSFYSTPQTIEALLMTVVDRILVHAGLEKDHFRWGDGSGNSQG
ncbi:MAG TPA: UbiX family flavin prenyltransferase [Bacteroidales bacterium]|nr:UbiX family flavin prenyltransferase [Bacteroidales bacterium]